VLARARDEARVLLTCDRRLADEAGPAAVLLAPESPIDQARALSALLPMDWRLAPFSRCVLDNAVLREAAAAEQARMPAASRARPGPFHVCPACGRLYWPGSHVRRMSAKLDDLAAFARQA
jgi:uncharacterized protein with PIN domain